MTRNEARERVSKLIESFGLAGQRRTLIGTPLQKGISGGQKRRVSVATQLITGPRVLYLDEPTSGLDSTASYEVISFIRDIARRNKVSHIKTELTWYMLLTIVSVDRNRQYSPTLH